MPGHTAPGGGSIPPELCVTVQKPDIVILNKHEKTIHLFELICPLEKYIDTRHTEKSNKYFHFTTDITEYKCKVNCFEVSSRGYISARNHTTLSALHKFIQPAIKLPQFKKKHFCTCINSITPTIHLPQRSCLPGTSLPPAPYCGQGSGAWLECLIAK